MLIMLMLALLTSSTFACDAGVFWGANCSMAKAASHDPACSAAPLNSNATTSSTTLIWNKMQGGRLGLGGDVFLSTTLNMGCGGGYYGSQVTLVLGCLPSRSCSDARRVARAAAAAADHARV